MFNNCFLISFLIIIIFNLLNFETHQCNIVPGLFDYTCYIPLCNIEIKNGSFHYKNYHIHHWIIGILILVALFFFEKGCLKSILQGIASAAFIDGLLFEDRFNIL
jgi:dolichol kinase